MNGFENALDLINRQKAEIERLLQKLQQPQSEAIKDCIKKIKSKSSKIEIIDNGIVVAGSVQYSISEVELCDVEKEMVGEDK